MNRTISEKDRCMISHSDLPKSMSEEPIKFSVCLSNTTQAKLLATVTTQDIFFREQQSKVNCRVFLCCEYAFDEDHRRKNLNPKAKKRMFVVYKIKDRNVRLFNWRKHWISSGLKNYVKKICKNKRAPEKE